MPACIVANSPTKPPAKAVPGRSPTSSPGQISISDHQAMSEWAGIGPVRRSVDGMSEPNGGGAERVLYIGGKIIEQVTADD